MVLFYTAHLVNNKQCIGQTKNTYLAYIELTRSHIQMLILVWHHAELENLLEQLLSLHYTDL